MIGHSPEQSVTDHSAYLPSQASVSAPSCVERLRARRNIKSHVCSCARLRWHLHSSLYLVLSLNRNALEGAGVAAGAAALLARRGRSLGGLRRGAADDPPV